MRDNNKRKRVTMNTEATNYPKINYDDPLERLEDERDRRERRELMAFLVVIFAILAVCIAGFVFLMVTAVRAVAAEPTVTVACEGKYVAFTATQPAGGERITYTALSGPGKNVTFNVTNTPTDGVVTWVTDVGRLVEANSYDVDYRIDRSNAQGVVASTVVRTPTCSAPKLVTTPTSTIVAPERGTLLPAVTLVAPTPVVEIPFREPYE